MKPTLLTLVVGFGLVLVHLIWHVLKCRNAPNLAVLFLLFLVGPALGEAVAVLGIMKQLYWDESSLEIGVFADHIYVIAFTSIALLYAAGHTVAVHFAPLLSSVEDPTQDDPPGSNSNPPRKPKSGTE